MRPKKNMPTNAVDLFRSRLDQIINLKHELAQLAGKIDWNWLDEQIAPLYSETGRPAVDLRPSKDGLELVVRYITRAPQRYDRKSQLLQEIVGLLQKRAAPSPAQPQSTA